MDETVKPRRPYDNRGRADQARRNRRRIVDATHQLLLSQGYRATTMAAIAREAGVSVETVYKAFKTKATLVKETYDIALAGDDEPIPLIDRPEMQALIADPDPVSKLRRYAAIASAIGSRTGPLLGVLLAAARGSGDADLEAFAATIDRERLFGASSLIRQLADTGDLRPDLSPDQARDIVWTLISPDLYRLLVVDRAWSLPTYETWLATTLITTLTATPP